MDYEPKFARIAALLGNPARAAVVQLLMDGRAKTALELASHVGLLAQTASGHLKLLTEGGILAVEPSGRQRRYRLRNHSVAAAVEALALAAEDRRPPSSRQRPALQIARTCYDHLAGQTGVTIADALVARRYLKPAGREYQITGSGEKFFVELGIDLARLRRQRRAFAPQCLDWSECRPHLAGALGAALTEHLMEKRWFSRVPQTRALRITPAGRRGLARVFSLDAEG
jgi:DNA-binding transcriptional ArsR family regulator